MTFVNLFVDLIKTASVVIVFAYLVTRTVFFTEVLEKRAKLKSRLMMILVFGVLSIFGTYGGVELPSGAIANIRDLGPLVAGLVGGPVVGIGAGIIGGLHRYSLGGFVAVPCSVATVIAGLTGGIVYLLRKETFPKVWQSRVWQAALIAILVELIHMGLTLLMAKPYDSALATVKAVILPMIISNAVSIAIFAYIVWNLVSERRMAAEKEKYRLELERKQFEIETARNIQKSFLPDVVPQIEGFDIAAFSLPALEVGGDFYDFIPITKDKWGFVIADVSGKGFPAALFMALSRTCVRAYAVGETTASGAITMANNLISQEEHSDMFVTLFYGMLNTDTRHLHYVNAGHNPPVVLGSKEGEKIVMLAAKGIALGIMPDIALEEKEIPLHEGEIVLLYTDGVTEAVNLKKEMFGEHRLIKLVENNRSLSAQEIVHKIEQEVVVFSEGQAQFDDLTLMVLKVLK